MDSEEQAAARRHATLGTLARPAQHEINNLLTVILANLDLLRRSAAEGAPRRQLERIGEAARRLDVSTRAMLSFSRRPVADPEAFAPSEAIAAIRPLLALLLPAPGALTIDGETTATVLADRAAFEDALLACAAALAADGRLAIAVTETEAAVVLDFALTGTATAAAIAALGLPATTDATPRMVLPRDPTGAGAPSG